MLDNDGNHGKATVTLHVSNLDAQITRLKNAGIDVPEPVKVEGFETLRYVEFTNPEDNTIGLLDGSSQGESSCPQRHSKDNDCVVR
ncbi:hypothetical protein [Sedimentitalea sp.]|uniref:hypothetical protein n=1 Tax=Sedimentitalea sp. TaxID=2048915 RepID=UPI003298F4B6